MRGDTLKALREAVPKTGDGPVAGWLCGVGRQVVWGRPTWEIHAKKEGDGATIGEPMTVSARLVCPVCGHWWRAGIQIDCGAFDAVRHGPPDLLPVLAAGWREILFWRVQEQARGHLGAPLAVIAGTGVGSLN